MDLEYSVGTGSENFASEDDAEKIFTTLNPIEPETLVQVIKESTLDP